MIKRTVEISREPAHLTVRDEQLLILRKRDDELRPRLPTRPENLAGSIPCEDLGILVVDERETTYSHSMLVKLAEHGCALVICGRDHHPIGMCLPIPTNSALLARLDAQLSPTRPTLKRLWTTIVRAKVIAQAAALAPRPEMEALRSRLIALSRRIRSGDPENIEAQAAAIYWPQVFSESTFIAHPFRRSPGDRSASPPNNLLDYGYAILRAAVARALVLAGLLPSLGIKHVGRSNPFCLADDLMEPLRPFVDRRVRFLAQRGEMELSQPIKAELLKVLTDSAEMDLRGQQQGVETGPLMVCLSRSIAGFVNVLEGRIEPEEMPIPRLIGPSLPFLGNSTTQPMRREDAMENKSDEQREIGPEDSSCTPADTDGCG